MDSKIDGISDKWADTISIKPSSPSSLDREPTHQHLDLLQLKTMPTLTELLPRTPLPLPVPVSVTSRRKAIPTKLMVDAAIKSQMTTKRSGVSLVAIKKFIAQNYQEANVDMNNRAKHIKRYIMSAIENGKLVRTRGIGVSGSFRLPLSETKLQKTIEKSRNNKLNRGKKWRALKTLKRIRSAGPSGSGGGSAGGKNWFNSALVKLRSRRTKSRGGAVSRKKK